MFTPQHRLARLLRRDDGRLFVVPLDHSVSSGPITIGCTLNQLVGRVASNGADAVVLHKGSVRYVDPRWFRGISLILHLSAGTRHANDPDAKYLVATVEEALRLGADAVSVHVNMGSVDERQQISDMAAVADSCDRWHMPLLAMVYPRGPQIHEEADPVLVAHSASLAADLGATMVKTPFAGTTAEMADVVRSCPIPLLAAGGAKRSEVLGYVQDVLRSGAAGVAMGRNVFQAADVGALVAQISALVHDRAATPGLVAAPAATASAGG